MPHRAQISKLSLNEGCTNKIFTTNKCRDQNIYAQRSIDINIIIFCSQDILTATLLYHFWSVTTKISSTITKFVRLSKYHVLDAFTDLDGTGKTK